MAAFGDRDPGAEKLRASSLLTVALCFPMIEAICSCESPIRYVLSIVRRCSTVNRAPGMRCNLHAIIIELQQPIESAQPRFASVDM